MKKFLIGVMVLMGIAVVNAGSSEWDDSVGYWMDEDCWSGDSEYLVPGWVNGNPMNVDDDWSSSSNKSYAYILGGKVMITSDSRPDGRVERIYVNGGELETSADYSAYKMYVGDEGTVGTVTQTDGTVTISRMYLSQDGGMATYDMSGGTLNVTSSAYIGDGGDCNFNLSGGTVNITAGTLYVGNEGEGYTTNLNITDGSLNAVRVKCGAGSSRGAGNVTISGGSFSVSKYLSMYSGSGSTFKVSGSGATSISLAQLSIYDETLAIELDADGSTLIEVYGTSTDSYKGANISGSTLAIDTLADFDGVVGDVYDILWSATTINVADMTIVSLGDVDFSYAVVEDTVNGGEILQVTVVPEPATMALLTIGGVLLRRRK